MSRPEVEGTTEHTEVGVDQNDPIKQPLIERLPRKDKYLLNTALCASGSIGLSLLITGHYTVGILVAGASATTYGIEWFIERFIDPKK